VERIKIPGMHRVYGTRKLPPRLSSHIPVIEKSVVAAGWVKGEGN